MKMKMKTLSVALLSLAVTLILASTGTATVYWEDNFDSYEAGSTLSGQTGPTGATLEDGWALWADPEIGSMAATTTSGQDGTLGAGPDPADPTGGGANQGNWLSIPKVSSGMLYVDFDMHVGSGRQSGPQWWLRDVDNGNMAIAPDWVDNANGGMDPQAGIELDYDNSNLMWGPDTQNIHGKLVFRP